MSEEQKSSVEYSPWYQPLLSKLYDLKQQQRFPHALIIQSAFCNGGLLFLKQLTMLLLCDEVEDSRSCGLCPSCRQISAGCYADSMQITIEYDEKTRKLNRDIKIDQIRQLIYFLGLSSQHNNFKIATIYPAERMNKSASNSLLKTLEEPTNDSFILLMTHNVGRLPVTIRSRCQQFELVLPAIETSRNWLENQGLKGELVTKYLDLAADDPHLALELKAIDFIQTVEQFRQLLHAFLKHQTDVTKLVEQLQNLQPLILQLILQKILTAYIQQVLSVNQKVTTTSSINKSKARALMNLQQTSFRNLQVENNNLNLQLQLTDVLISLKQILTGSS